MRVLALDYGSARCGCALSDPTGTLATPIEAVERASTRKGLARIADLVRDRDVDRVVVGLPTTLAGGESRQTREAIGFAEALQARIAPVPVEMYDERFTTAIASRTGGTSTSEDSRAAAVLLEGWLIRHAREARS